MSTPPLRPLPAAVFVDSSAWYAILDPTDAHHTRAAQLADALSRSRTQLYITNLIRAECHALILNRLGHYAADRFLQILTTLPMITIFSTESEEQQALALIEKYQDKNFSFTDAVSFVVMDNLQIRTAFSFDKNFQQYGLVLL
jgi:predicted nucleic acid-binding protein